MVDVHQRRLAVLDAAVLTSRIEMKTAAVDESVSDEKFGESLAAFVTLTEHRDALLAELHE
jgi:hypothetical protein